MTNDSSSAFWNKIAEKYAARALDDPQAYEVWLARVLAHLKATDRVLEVGCGTGSTALRLAPHVQSFLAADFAPRMIEIAEEKRLAEGTDNLRFVCADPFSEELLPADGEPYDVVMAYSFLHLVKDPMQMVQHLADQLRPGGLLITKTVCLKHMSFVFVPLIGTMRLFGMAPPVKMVSGAELDEMMRSAGLQLVEERDFGKKVRHRFLIARKP